MTDTTDPLINKTGRAVITIGVLVFAIGIIVSGTTGILATKKFAWVPADGDTDMSYNYQVQRPSLFTDDGQRRLFEVRDRAEKCIKFSGAVRSNELLIGTGDTWDMLARIDRLVELKYLREITGSDVAGQHRVFVAGSAWSNA
jgi:hypothetical protein